MQDAAVGGVSLVDKRVFTTGEAAALCKLSQQTIIRCFDAGRLGGFKVPGSKFRRIPRKDLLKFMRDNNIPTEALRSGVLNVYVFNPDCRSLGALEVQLGDRAQVEQCSDGYEFLARWALDASAVATLLVSDLGPHRPLVEAMRLVCDRDSDRCIFVPASSELIGINFPQLRGVDMSPGSSAMATEMLALCPATSE